MRCTMITLCILHCHRYHWKNEKQIEDILQKLVEAVGSSILIHAVSLEAVDAHRVCKYPRMRPESIEIFHKFRHYMEKFAGRTIVSKIGSLGYVIHPSHLNCLSHRLSLELSDFVIFRILLNTQTSLSYSGFKRDIKKADVASINLNHKFSVPKSSIIYMIKVDNPEAITTPGRNKRNVYNVPSTNHEFDSQMFRNKITGRYKTLLQLYTTTYAQNVKPSREFIIDLAEQWSNKNGHIKWLDSQRNLIVEMENVNKSTKYLPKIAQRNLLNQILASGFDSFYLREGIFQLIK